MTVLVTRPGEQGISLCRQLNQQGIKAINHPLIAIRAGEQLPSSTKMLPQADIIITVSQHTIEFTHQSLTIANSCWPKNATYLAVGQKTAQFLSKFTNQKVHYPEIGDSENLLELPQLKNVSGKRIVILRGNGGRELIYDTLIARGAHVEYCEVYKRENLAFRSEIAVPFWQDSQVDQLIITSSGQLSFFIDQIAPPYRNWIFKLALFVPSERIAIEARRVGFHTVVNTGSASNKDLLAALAKETGRKQ
ncbi:uroporphyrinogen-III synthase [Vibrio sp. 404]|uniref:Uroporphyrinogen-III synthase n=1 Tax=Vibrio marinisediminis TaxID=2758441 RepID=A0A7W2FUF2_9VIBR|nr:uroporphyrinogen-III synthase [Vibrio marinisediminis]MBA5764432.1 uroporphyrinogen-III synthase [Vibrio marinisediminis]